MGPVDGNLPHQGAGAPRLGWERGGAMIQWSIADDAWLIRTQRGPTNCCIPLANVTIAVQSGLQQRCTVTARGGEEGR